MAFTALTNNGRLQAAIHHLDQVIARLSVSGARCPTCAHLQYPDSEVFRAASTLKAMVVKLRRLAQQSWARESGTKTEESPKTEESHGTDPHGTDPHS